MSAEVVSRPLETRLAEVLDVHGPTGGWPSLCHCGGLLGDRSTHVANAYRAHLAAVAAQEVAAWLGEQREFVHAELVRTQFLSDRTPADVALAALREGLTS